MCFLSSDLQVGLQSTCPGLGLFHPKGWRGTFCQAPLGVPSVCPWFDGQLSFRAGGNPGGHRCLCSDTPKSVDTTPHDAISAQETDDHSRMQCPLARLVWEMAHAHSAVPGVGLYPQPGEGVACSPTRGRRPCKRTRAQTVPLPAGYFWKCFSDLFFSQASE